MARYRTLLHLAARLAQRCKTYDMKNRTTGTQPAVVKNTGSASSAPLYLLAEGRAVEHTPPAATRNALNAKPSPPLRPAAHVTGSATRLQQPMSTQPGGEPPLIAQTRRRAYHHLISEREEHLELALIGMLRGYDVLNRQARPGSELETLLENAFGKSALIARKILETL